MHQLYLGVQKVDRNEQLPRHSFDGVQGEADTTQTLVEAVKMLAIQFADKACRLLSTSLGKRKHQENAQACS